MQTPITLWEIMKLFKARDFMLFTMNLEFKTEFYKGCREKAEYLEAHSPPPKEEFEWVLNFLKESESLCDDAGLPMTAAILSLNHIELEGAEDKADYSTLYADFRNVTDVLMAEFWNRKFVQIPKDYEKYANNESLFGDIVKAAFPSAGEDIKQAGNCLAVECGTGAVFHLMRAVEWGLRALCRDLGIIRIRKKKTGKPKYTPIAWTEWQDMLEEAHKRTDAKILALKAGKRKQDAQEFYYPLLRDLRGFKEAFRNHVMHARSEYTPKRAEDVLDHVQRFMILLSTKVKE